MLTGCGGTGVCSRGVHLLQLRESFQLIDYLLGRRGSLYKKHNMSVSIARQLGPSPCQICLLGATGI